MTKKLFLRLLILLSFVFSSSVVSIFLFIQVYSNNQDPSDGLASVLISEIRLSGGTGKTTDEFIELYNPNQETVDISGWTLARQTRTASSSDRDVVLIFPNNTVLPGQRHLLVSHVDYSSSTLADFTYAGVSITDDNSVLLIDKNNQTIDLVGYGKATNAEIVPALTPTTQFLSIERLPGGAEGNSQNTHNNSVDFVRAISSPQNLASSPTPSPNPSIVDIVSSTTEFVSPIVTNTEEVITSTLYKSDFVTTTSGVANNEGIDAVINIPATIIEKPSSPVPSSVLITELLPIPDTGQVEFVEIYNRTLQTVSLSDWWLEDGGGSKTILSGVILPQQYLVIEKPKGNLNNSGDQVSLLVSDNTLIDRVTYGDWNNGSIGNNAPEPKLSFSLARPYEDVDIGDDHNGFVLTDIITPGAKNQIESDTSQDQVTNTSTDYVINQKETTLEEPDKGSDIIKETKIPRTTVLRVKVIGEKSVEFGEPALFDASETIGTGDIGYVWDMGDGTEAEGESIDHIYNSPGYYVITLTTSDNTMRRTKKIKVQVKEPPKKKNIETTATKTVTQKKNMNTGVETVGKSIFVPIKNLAGIKTNTTVTVTGLIAAEPNSYSKKKEFYVIDESENNSGVRILYKKETPAIIRGDKVTVTGRYTVKKDEAYIVLEQSDFLVLLRHDTEPLPRTEKINGLGRLAGGLVTVSGEVTEAKKDYAFIDDKTGELKINGILKEKMLLHDQAKVTGVLIKTKDGVELNPRPGDVTIKQTSIATTSEFNSGSGSSISFGKRLILLCALCVVLAIIIIKKILHSQKINKLEPATIE